MEQLNIFEPIAQATHEPDCNCKYCNKGFKTIPQFENYEINRLGQIRNKKTLRIMKPWNNGNGYLKIMLYKDKTRHRVFVHRLMGYTFLKLTDDMTIDHKNDIRHDNSLTNLQVMTLSDNIAKMWEGRL